MPEIRQQKLHSIEFVNLKSLVNLNITFEPHAITGIFGINGSGKSSIIHALLAIYKPGDQTPNRRNFKFSTFFTPTTHTKWIGSNFVIKHSFRQDGNLQANLSRTYSKPAERWNPRYTSRPERDVFFVGLDSCVPAIELERREALISLTTTNLNDNISIDIRNVAGYVLSRNYDEYNQHGGGNKKYIGLRHNAVQYSSLSMGAGEQRVFKILETVYRAPKHSLIVIDEIDLTLHTDALMRLVSKLKERADDKGLQIVFTSHREELAKRDDINIRHIFQTGGNTLCFDATNPDCISRLTGVQQRPLEIFIEDDMAEAIARKVAAELNIVRHCSIKRFGAAVNAFPLAMGMHLKGTENLENIALFLDGDMYVTQGQKEDAMKKIYSGTEANAVQRRIEALSCIDQFTLPAGVAPEVLINNAIRGLNDGSEVVNAANAINGALNKHEYVTRIIDILGYPKHEGLSIVAGVFATTPEWIGHTQSLRDWLQGRKAALNL